MNALTSSNPVLKEGYFERASADTMTVEGVINRSAFMLLILLAAALPAWQLAGPVTLFGGLIAGLGLGLGVVFAPRYAYVTAPLYAAAEGLVLGAFSSMLEAQYPGIAIQAVLLTSGVFVTMLTLYQTGTIEVTQSLRTGIAAATGGILFVYLISFFGRMFLGTPVPYIHGSGPIGIGFSLVVVGIAAFNLLTDFDFISRMAKKDTEKHYEWLGAFGLIVTLVWLYIEILILLSKLRE